MDKKLRVGVVSGFGRGHWLAVELTTLGLEVFLVDITEGLGRWAPEDAEGPFGLFHAEDLSQTQLARLDQEDYAEAVDEGFVLWLKSGPLDLRGPHSAYQLEKREIGHDVQEYVGRYDQIALKQREDLRKKILREPFLNNWFANFAHELASPVYLPNRNALEFGRPLPLMAPWSVRRVSRRGMEKSLQWVADAGVRVFEKAKLKDISFQGRSCESVEIESDWSGILRADRWIWALSSGETARLGAKFQEELFPQGVLQPDWVWMRFRIGFESENSLIHSLPLKCVVVEDLSLPWAHANLVVLQKTVSKDGFDAWVRIPEVHRFQKSYMEEIAVEMLRHLNFRLSGAPLKVIDYPQDYHYDEKILGPSRFPVFDLEAREHLKRRPTLNMHFDGPELWETLDWTGTFTHQKALFENVKSWKVEIDRKIEKMRERENRRARENQSEDSP